LPWLTDVEEKVKLLYETDMDWVAVISFTLELAQLRAREFIPLLKNYLKMQSLLVGPDFTLGRNREGNIDLLRSLGQEMNFNVEAIAPFTRDGEMISSTLIRQALAQGDMTKVERLMGRHFYVISKIITADQRGHVLGFPTANLDIPSQQALPDNGVYATIAHVDGQIFASATNIGIRPTFGNNKKTVETHLLNYAGNLYGKKLKIEFVQKLREEHNFASPEELKTQISKDIRQIEIILSRESK
ncbi:MAG: riboflavin biosynthesis protein RibF, partial [Chloroflexota bacterium]|nr:riboflavin biosynthesis protein RibF [Chloroflexota bacterium]